MSRFLSGALLGLTSVFVYELGGEVEGRIWPVMGQLELSEPEAYPPPSYRTRWKGRATKLRNCNFVRLEWYLGPRHGRHVEVEVEFTDPPEIRMAGELHWDGIVISLVPEATLRNSHADVLHRCPGRPWLTRTPFFTSRVAGA